MTAYRYQDLIAWQMAEAFKREVFRIVLASRCACADLGYKDQLFAAAASVAANIAEGFVRKAPGDFRRFLRIALGSLAEAEVRLRDGIALSYVTDRECAPGLPLWPPVRCCVNAAREITAAAHETEAPTQNLST